MKIIPLSDITIDSSNIPADTTTLWDITAGYAVDITRRYGNKLYTSAGTINPICDYVYDDTDPDNADYTYNAETLTQVDETVVPCVQNDTIVYDKADTAFYQYTGASGNVDFTNIDFSASGSWIVATDYRFTQEFPDDSLFWFDEGFINEFKMLDSSLSTQTENSGDIILSFQIFKNDTLSFLNLDNISSIDLTVTNNSDSVILYDDTINTQTRIVNGWFDYFFSSFSFKKNVILEIPISYGATVDVTLYGVDTKIGLLASGRSEDKGLTQYGARIGLNDFSKKEADEDGNFYIEEGKYQRTNDLQVRVNFDNIDDVVERLDELRATPCIYSGADMLSSTKIFGFYRDYSLLVNTPKLSILNIEIESLT